MKSPKKAKGQILVIFALAAVALVIFAGLAIDGGMVYVSRQNMQSAADSAAFAAGYAQIKGRTTSDIQTAGRSVASTEQ